MKYEIFVYPGALKALKKIQKKDQFRIQGAIELLRENPFPPNHKKLKNSPEYRIKIGKYRVIYTVNKNQLVILVIKIGHRNQIYKK